MKYCPYCGNQIDDTTLFCTKCGAPQGQGSNPGGFFGGQNNGYYQQGGPYNGYNQGGPYNGYNNGGPFGYNQQRPYNPGSMQGSKWVSVLCFIFPILGLIFWFIWRYTEPGKAGSAAKGALMGVSFSSPLIGLIIWLAYKNTNPALARGVGISALAGAIFIAVVTLIELILVWAGVIEPYYYDAMASLFK